MSDHTLNEQFKESNSTGFIGRVNNFRDDLERSTVSYYKYALPLMFFGAAGGTGFAVTGNPTEAAISVITGLGLGNIALPIVARNNDKSLLKDWALITAGVATLAFGVGKAVESLSGPHETVSQKHAAYELG